MSRFTLTDLEQRGLLDETLVLFGSEFGRMPTAQGPDGRDHNITGYPMFLAGVSNSFFGRYAFCIALLAISFVLLPLIALLWPALPGAIGRTLFYWPQYALLPGGLRAVAGVVPR